MAQDKRSRGGAAKVPPHIWQEVWGIVFLFLGVFTFLALLSYNHADPSLFSQTKRLPMNYGGRIGANMAEALIQFSGIAAFICSALFLSFAAKLFRGTQPGYLIANFAWQRWKRVLAPNPLKTC